MKLRAGLIVSIISVLFGLNQQLAATEVNINVTADPPLPAANMIKNSSFEEPVGGSNFWAGCGYYKGKGEIKVVADQAHSGEMSVCATGFSDDAAGQIFSQEFYVPTDIRLSLDFRVRSGRELPRAGSVSLRYFPDSKDIMVDGVDAQITPLIKIPEKWIQFSNPPKDIAAESHIFFWEPRTKDAPRTSKAADKNIITFSRDKFGSQDKVKVRLYILVGGIGVLWYDDITLKPLETRLTYTVKGSDVTEIKVYNGNKAVVEQKTFSTDWPGEYCGNVIVPVDYSYRIEVKNKTGEIKYEEYPAKTN